MKLYCTPNSTFSRRVRIALLEKGLQAEELEADAPRRAAPWFRALNPFGRIPVLVDGETTIYESSAILVYLEERFPEPALVPPNPAGRARAAMFVKLCDLEYAPFAVQVQRPKRLQPREAWDLDAMLAAKAPLERHYAFLERELEGREYLVAERFTWADLAYLPFLHFHELLEVELPPAVTAWRARLAARESARATVPAI